MPRVFRQYSDRSGLPILTESPATSSVTGLILERAFALRRISYLRILLRGCSATSPSSAMAIIYDPACATLPGT